MSSQATYRKLKASTDFSLLCECGHSCGEHLAERFKHTGTGEIIQECLAAGCKCTCYKKAPGQKPKLEDPYQAGREDDRLQAAMWHKLPKGGSYTPCIACGRPVNDFGEAPITMLHLVEGGRFAKAGIEHDENDPGEMGWFPLGRACARKYDLSDLAQESWDYETREALYTKGAKS